MSSRLVRLLLLQEDDSSVDAVCQGFADVGYLVFKRRALAAEEMAAFLVENTFDLIVADFVLPSFSAHEALQLVEDYGVEVPLFVLSNALSDRQEQEVVAAGATACFGGSELTQLVEVAVRGFEDKRKGGSEESEVRHLETTRVEDEKFLRVVIDTDPNLIYVKDMQGRFIMANKATAVAYGATVDQLVGGHDEDFGVRRSDQGPGSRDDMLAISLDGERVIPEEKITDSKGRVRWFRSVRRPLFDSDGKVDRILGVSVDITDAKRANEELRSSRERLNLIIETIPSGLLVIDVEGVLRRVNRQVETMVGASSEELLGTSINEILPTGWRDWQALNPRATFRYLSEPGIARLETSVLCRDGATFPAEIGISQSRTSAGVLTLVTMVDVTEKQALESQLLQAQKMEAIGRLAGGLAHDFNNVLGVIIGFGELGEAELPDDHPVQKLLGEIRGAANQAAELTRQMLAFSRLQVLRPQLLDLNRVVGDSLSMLGQMIGEDITLKLHLDPSIAAVKADPNQVTQVLMNLAVNARDAMPEGGTLIFETMNFEMDGDYVEQHGVGVVGPFVQLTVTDTGTGMDQRTQMQVFEPFFSTKVEGKGTGLGLSTAYGIVKQSGGYIWLYSEVGIGTTFRVYLPAADEAANPLVSTEAPEVTTATGSERILLVEDQEALRRVTARLLRKLGYEVLTAQSAEEAFAVGREDSGRIDLLLTDIVMPGVNGHELASQMGMMRPELKVLLMSGYSSGLIAERGLLGGEIQLLEKPFSSSSLASAVRRALDEERPGPST